MSPAKKPKHRGAVVANDQKSSSKNADPLDQIVSSAHPLSEHVARAHPLSEFVASAHPLSNYISSAALASEPEKYTSRGDLEKYTALAKAPGKNSDKSTNLANPSGKYTNVGNPLDKYTARGRRVNPLDKYEQDRAFPTNAQAGFVECS